MRRILYGAVLAMALITALALSFRAELSQLWAVSHLFDEEDIVQNFQHMDQIFPTRRVAAGGTILEFEQSDYTLPENFEYDGKSYDTESFLSDTMTTGLLIMQDDRILLERYALGHSQAGRHIAWSVSKSVMSALFGVAVEEGHIRDIKAPVTDYLPELIGSGYDGVPIKDVLQMSSGVGFNEDYGDPDSDINRMGRELAMGGTLLEFAATLERERPPGTVQHYVSIDTQVLGTILVRATGKSLADYTSEKLWQPVGMEQDAYWMVDGSGMEMAFGGFNASLRDFARFGRLYLNGGRWEGKQIIPASWVEDSVTPDAPHLMPGPKPDSDNPMGYGYQWWIPADSHGDFMALGIYNQMIFVDPENRLVIAKHSANPDFQRNNFESTRETVALWRAVASDLDLEQNRVTP
jgi:CubicO group peptidase (beta-lactamase class C family)